MIPKEIIDKIRQSVNIVDAVSKYAELKKRGKYYWCLCPFEPENTPSFTVDEVNQRYRCYSCGRNGNVFDFIAEKEHLSFPQSVLRIADDFGIKVDEKYRRESSGRYNESQKQIIQLNKMVSELLNHLLLNTDLSKEALRYLLAKRHLDRDTISDFQLGFLPKNWSLHDFLNSKNIDSQLQLESGLVSQYDDGSIHDVFSNRIIFPIKDEYGNVMGFSGRTLDPNNSAKYINSKENAVFKKSKILYHFDLAKQAAKVSGRFLLLEGYFDVIAAHKVGVDYGIASMGTSLTKDQLSLITKNSSQLTIAYDGDSAGQHAIWRAINEGYDIPGLKINVLTFPGGQDPDEYLQENGNESLESFLNNNSISINDFAFEYLKKDHNLSSTSGIAAYTEELLDFLRKINDPIESDLTIKKLSEQFGINRQILERSFGVKKQQKKVVFNDQDNHFVPNKDLIDPLEKKQLLIERKLIVSSIVFESVFNLLNKKTDFSFLNKNFQLYFFFVKGYRSEHPGVDNIFNEIVSEMSASEKKDFIEQTQYGNNFYATNNLQAINDYIWQLQVRIPFDKKINDIKAAIQQAINLNQSDQIQRLNVQLANLMKEKAENTYE